MAIPYWDWSETGLRAARIAGAYLLSLPIGWSWEKIRHNTGLRTFPLVSIASCCYVLVARKAFGAAVISDDHILQGLMTGIGFIGGGAIFTQGVNVHGTAAAASIWCIGALGAAVGYGAYDIAILLAVVNFLTLHMLRPLKESLDQFPAERDGD
jgi:putative Mg2+ transporter-C (MgtC) family protein